MYLPLGELTWRRARAGPLHHGYNSHSNNSAQGCTPVNTSAVTTLVFGMPGMAQRIWTTHTPAAQPVCAHADTAYAAAGETRSRTRPTSYELFRSTPIAYPYHDRGTRVSPLPAQSISRVTHVIEVGCCCSLTRLFSLARCSRGTC